MKSRFAPLRRGRHGKSAFACMILALVFFTPRCLFCQSASDLKARELYAAAVASHEKGNFASSVSNLMEAIRLLGRTNIRIQPLLVRSLFGMKDYPNAEKEVTAYFSLSPDSALAEYAEMASLRQKIKEALARDDADFEKAKKGDEKAVRAYLSAFPFGLHGKEAGEILDENTWAAAMSGGRYSSYAAYLSAFPGGLHKAECQKRMGDLDAAAWDAALKMDSPASYRSYLSECPGGAHASEASQRIGALLDEEAYAKAAKTNVKDSYAAYLKAWPKGRHAAEARAKYDEFVKEESRIAAEKAAADREKRAKERKAMYDSYNADATGHYVLGSLEFIAGVGAGAFAIYEIMQPASEDASTSDTMLRYLLAGGCAVIVGASIALAPQEFEAGNAAYDNAQRYAFLEPPRFTVGLVPAAGGGDPFVLVSLTLSY